MARRFAKVSEEEIEEAFFYPSDLANTNSPVILWQDLQLIATELFSSPII